MVRVFTDEFVAGMARFDDKPGWFAPGVRFLALSPDRAEIRAWIEDQVEACEEDARAKLVPRLQSDRHLITTMHELAVLDVLRQAGLSPHYEVVLPATGLTPDIWVEGNAEPASIIEVWTRRPPDEVRDEAQGWKELRGRVSWIPASLALRVESATPGQGLRPPAGGRAKAIATKLQAWLLRMTTGPGSVLDIDGYRFYVVGQVATLGAFLLPIRSGGWVGTEDLITGIAEKVSRYGPAAAQLGARLAVVVAPDGVPVDLELLRLGMWGQQSFAATFNIMDSGLIAGHTIKLKRDDAPSAFGPVLSGIGVLTAPGPQPRLEFIRCPAADRPLAWPDTESMVTWSE